MNMDTKLNEVTLEVGEIVAVKMKGFDRDITLFLEATSDGIVVNNGTISSSIHMEIGKRKGDAKVLFSNAKGIQKWDSFELLI